jgi:hypothetical protein
MQTIAQVPLIPVPVKPDCLVWYAGDPCDELIQQYHRAADARQQEERQLSVSVPLQKQIVEQQKQIADQQAQIKALQLRIESQTVEAVQNQARNDALMNGIGAGLGAALAFLVAVASFRRLARTSAASRREQARAASA